jgi:hypothetical protein
MTSLIYNTGTVSVTNGSATVTGSLTGWAVALVTGGLLSVEGVTVPILSVESDTSLTLAYDWPDTSGAGKAYAIARESSEAALQVGVWTVDRLGKLSLRPWGVGVIPDGRGTLAERDAVTPLPNDNYCWLRIEVDEPAELYFRDGGVWLGPYLLQGEAGDVGPVGPQGPSGDGFNPAGAWLIGTTYAKNDMVSFGGRTFVSFAGSNIGHQPPSSDADDAYWQFVPAAVGPQGPQGDAGATGADGDDGWTPTLAIVSDGARRVQQVIDWVGGTGTKPATGKYVGVSGLVDAIGDAVDIRGASGSGTGDMQASVYDPSNKSADAFSMDNMVEGTTTKIMTATERAAIAALGTASTKDTGTSAGNVPLLDGSGLIPSALLPSYVDDVLEYANLGAFPGTGEAGKIYVALDTNKTYRWSGSAYVEISASPGSTDAVTEGATNLYFTAARVRSTVLTGLSLATNAAITASDTVLSAFGKLQKQVTDLLARSVATQHSLTGGGDFTTTRTLSLVNDTASPGNNKVYGTDGSGVRGWKDDPSGGLGVGQTWQSVSRTLGTSYQNTTGKTIAAAGRFGAAAGGKAQVSTNGSTWVDVMTSGAVEAISFYLVVPDTHYYRTTGNGTITAELRP